MYLFSSRCNVSLTHLSIRLFSSTYPQPLRPALPGGSQGRSHPNKGRSTGKVRPVCRKLGVYSFAKVIKTKTWSLTVGMRWKVSPACAWMSQKSLEAAQSINIQNILMRGRASQCLIGLQTLPKKQEQKNCQDLLRLNVCLFICVENFSKLTQGYKHIAQRTLFSLTQSKRGKVLTSRLRLCSITCLKMVQNADRCLSKRNKRLMSIIDLLSWRTTEIEHWDSWRLKFEQCL